jgi:hypothetical protein
MEPATKKLKIEDFNKLKHEFKVALDALQSLSSLFDDTEEAPIPTATETVDYDKPLPLHLQRPFPCNNAIVQCFPLNPAKHPGFGTPLQPGTMATALEYCVSKGKCYAHAQFNDGMPMRHVGESLAYICKRMDPSFEQKTVNTKNRDLTFRIPEDVPILEFATRKVEVKWIPKTRQFEAAFARLRAQLPGWEYTGQAA